jgi:hypothetical protein
MNPFKKKQNPTYVPAGSVAGRRLTGAKGGVLVETNYRPTPREQQIIDHNRKVDEAKLERKIKSGKVKR